ncbi:MAG: hypothetical protein J7K68_01725 [Candidatus Diapherotrites archaeon]|nr:hypothetical protein [Candidatus Diapherotrites archaeon]
MKKLGQVISISASGYMIVRNRDIPRIGTKVYAGNGKYVGKVYKILGPTKKPYILIEGHANIGDKLFVR